MTARGSSGSQLRAIPGVPPIDFFAIATSNPPMAHHFLPLRRLLPGLPQNLGLQDARQNGNAAWPRLDAAGAWRQQRRVCFALGGCLIWTVGSLAQGHGAPSLAAPSPTPHLAQAPSPSLKPSPLRGPATKAPDRKLYQPLPLRSGETIEDTLTAQDIPMGQGSFARDYLIELDKDDQVAIDLLSDSFDTVVTLMTENGTTLGENDDGPDGGTNSLLFMRIPQSGNYIVRVRGFGQAKGGPFKLRLTKLKASE